MQIRLLLAFLPVAWFATGMPAQIVLRDQISQFGITWTFDKKYETGQYANGDYWAVGPVKIVTINPPSRSGTRIKNGSMINPSPKDGQKQGYDNKTDHNSYDPAMNVALDVSASKPLIVPAHSSLVSTISVDAAGARPQLKGASILTVVPKAAAPGDFRPPFCGTDKTSRFNVSQLDYAQLQRLKPVGTPPTMASLERLFERPWLEHIPNWTGKYIHPSDNHPAYGREIAVNVGKAALVLHLDLPVEKKKTLLVRFIQVGIDKQGIADDGGEKNWIENGGHHQGRKWPILFAGLVLGDAHMTNVGSQDVWFSEDMQTYYITQADIARVGFPQSDLGKPMWGFSHTTRPERDQLWGQNPYQLCCTGNSMHGCLLAALVMNAKALWKHDAAFDYQDRYVAQTKSENRAGFEQSWDGWSLQMWNAYRNTLSNPLRLSFKSRVASAFALPAGTANIVPPPKEIRLSWNLPPDKDADSYRVYRGKDAAQLSLLRGGVKELFYADPGVGGGQTIYYQLSVVDATGKELRRSNTVRVDT